MLALNLKNTGLLTYNNQVTTTPGSMSIASDVVIDKPDVVETRRGFKQFGTTLTTPIYKLFAFQNRIIAHHASLLSYDSTGAGAWVDYAGTFVAISGDKIRGTEANQNFYLTTNNGINKIDTLTNAPYQAGGVPALDTTVALTGVTGFLNDNSQCAYRITWVYTDANSNQIEGNPSMAVTILASAVGHTSNAAVTFTIPSTVTTAYYYRIYRTPQTNSTSIPPGDTFQLAYQAQPTGADIIAKSITVTDVTDDTLLGTILYTSPGAQGEFQTNDQPPLAHDICFFQNMTFYFNCSTIQQFYINLVSVGAPNGIQLNDTVSLVGTATNTYTAKAANNFASQQFKFDTSGTVAQNIDNTARNLVSAINQDSTNTEFYAYYVSGFNQLPGQILIRARNLSHAIFYGLCSRTTAPAPFSPALPSSGTTYASSNNTVLNGIYVSKISQPEAVPAVNLFFAGSGDQAIYRGYALRDAVIIESAGGVFRLTGTSPSTITITPFDNTVIQFGNETGVTLNNSVYSYTTQGAISVTESGSQIMSRNIEGDILTLSAPSLYANFKNIAFGISYESDRKYILAMSTSTSATIISNIQYVYNWVTQAWTTWTKSITAGIVNPFDNLLYLAESDGQVTQERKSFTLTDYTDREYSTVTLISYSGTSVVMSDVTQAVVGYTLAQHVSTGSVELASVITAINTATKTITVTDSLNWYVNILAGYYQPINSTVTYSPLTCGYPNYIKAFSPIMQYVFSQSFFTNATVTLSTDFYNIGETISLTPQFSGAWGTFPWGTLAWGVSGVPLQMIPAYLTKNTFQSHWLNISVTVDQAFQNLSLNGISGFFNILGERYR